jgi:AraC-like DNA-binding protein
VEAIDNDQADDLVNREWFLDLIEKIICHEYGNFLALNGLNSVKIETRKEILRRLKLAREYMDAQYLSIEEVGEVATACHMSEFHFFRSFRQAFNCSPYQYIMGKRLNHAKDLLQEKKWSVTEVAHYCNFPDVFTFSKAFKKRFNISPSAFHAVRRP